MQGMKRLATEYSDILTNETRNGTNPRLKYVYRQSHMFYAREELFGEEANAPELERMITRAFLKMLKRVGREELGEKQRSVCWVLTDMLHNLAWERLHADAIEKEFFELEFQVLLAGHLPLGVEGKDWKTCKILYC